LRFLLEIYLPALTASLINMKKVMHFVHEFLQASFDNWYEITSYIVSVIFNVIQLSVIARLSLFALGCLCGSS